MAFVFDRRRVEPSGLACELVVLEEWLEEIAPDALHHQFARTPYGVSFRCGSETFILVTLHVTYGYCSADRVPELRGIARGLREWAGPNERLVAEPDRPGRLQHRPPGRSAVAGADLDGPDRPGRSASGAALGLCRPG